MPDLIFISMEDWDDVWRRNQFVCAELARRYPQQRILFVGVHRNVWRHLKRGDWKTVVGNPTWAVPGHPNITVTRALRIAPERFTWGRWLNEFASRVHVRRVARRSGIEQFVLWLNPHYAVHMAGRMGEAAVIYDVTDDWIQLQQPEGLARLVAEQDRELCARADAVIVCSPRLRDLKRDLAERVHLIPNGVDAAHYRQVLDGVGPLPAIAAEWSRPVIGYTGTIHSDRIDTGLIAKLATELPEATVALIGPDMLTAEDRRLLMQHGNIKLVGPVPYADIPKYMRAFDVCITPHRVTPFTESLNPIKFWEYLAAGKPIVSTDVAGFREYPQFVRVAGDHDGFVHAVREALTEPVETCERRRAEARRHSWTSRVDAIEDVIRACIENRTAAEGVLA